MKFLILVVTVCLAASVLGRGRFVSNADLADEWEEWKENYEKDYVDSATEAEHRRTWEHNYRTVQKHNRLYEQGKTTFTMGMNILSDLKMAGLETPVTFTQALKASKKHHIKHASSQSCGLPSLLGKDYLPPTIDWRTQGYVTEVKTQLPQKCLHSQYFTITGALEGQWFRKTGKLISLSEQNLADCCGAGSQQCTETGEPCTLDQVYSYIKSKGVESIAEYPDTRADQQCAYDPSKRVATCSGYSRVPANESSLQIFVATVGPISVMIDSTQPSFQNYKGGVYNEPKCSSTVLDRNLLVVGYGTDPQGGDYWLCKNSWGPSWGESGYIRMSRNQGNQCGIANVPTYPYFSC